jgi:hypothetical protein
MTEELAVGEEQKLKEERELIRSELNIERWPLFTTSRFKGKSREYVRREVEGDSVKLKKVVIGRLVDKEVGVLRIFDLKCFYALVKLWEEAGRPGPDEMVTFSLHELGRILKLGWGGKTHREIKESLLRLRGLPITWISAFYRKDTDTTEELLELFTILSELKIYERRKGGRLQAGYSQFRFNERLVLNLLGNYTKPLYLNVILNLEKEISVLLYLHLDLVMADKTHYARRTGELIAELDLSGDYRYPSYRRRVLEPALKELEGVELSTGKLTYAKLQKLPGGQDWKAVFKKEPRVLPRAGSGKASSGRLPTGRRRSVQEKELFEIEALVDEMIAVTEDPKSRQFYTKVARRCPTDLIYRVLSEVKEEWHEGLIRTTKGAVFTDKIKRYCQERGIDLGLKG